MPFQTRNVGSVPIIRLLAIKSFGGSLVPHWFFAFILLLQIPHTRGSDRPLEFRAWVQVSYPLRSNLRGWENTSKSLAALLPGFDTGTDPIILIDQGPEMLEDLIAAPSKRRDSFKVLYLGLHVNRRGEMLFASGKASPPGEVVAQVATQPDRWKPDIVIVDSCHAAAFAYDRVWVDAFPCPHLFAADTHQLAWERNLDNRHPIHLAKLYPKVRHNLAAILGESWNGRISDLGFRAAKHAASSGGTSDCALDFIQGITAVSLEKVESTRFRSSDLLWVTPDRLIELSR